MKYLLPILLLFTCCSKVKNDKKVMGNKIPEKSDSVFVKSILVERAGGKMGFSQTLRLTQDSLFFDFNIAVDSTKRRSARKPNSVYKLENIIEKS